LPLRSAIFAARNRRRSPGLPQILTRIYLPAIAVCVGHSPVQVGAIVEIVKMTERESALAFIQNRRRRLRAAEFIVRLLFTSSPRRLANGWHASCLAFLLSIVECWTQHLVTGISLVCHGALPL
jgi:hypothetical protein